MECTQILLSESCNDIDTVTEKCPAATLSIGGVYHTIYNTENVIGRDSKCDVVINNSAVSSKHAVIEAEDLDAHLIYDLGSTNKTKLGKMMLKPHVRYHINDGDYVMFGNVSAQYNISRQYSTTPVKEKSVSNSFTVPETPERPEPIKELNDYGDIKDKTKAGSSGMDLSDTDMFDEKNGNSNEDQNKIPISLSNVNNDIYELDTLSFDDNVENEEKPGLVSKHESKESNIISNKNDLVESMSVANLCVYDISTQEPEGDVKQLGKDKSKNNYGWEDFPEIASPFGLDTSNADNLDCPKPKLSSSLLDITSDDLKKNHIVSKTIEGEILSDSCKTKEVESPILHANSSQELFCKESGSKNAHQTKTTGSLEKLDLDTMPIDSKNSISYDLKQEQYVVNDYVVPFSQNVDMFEESPKKSSQQDDVYEMLTQVSTANGEINDTNESIYEIQTQLTIVRNDHNISLQNDKLSNILEPASQPLDTKINDLKNSSFTSVKVIDETNQECSFSTSMYEAATQPYPQFCEEKLVSSVKEVSNEKLIKENENKDLDKKKSNVSTHPKEIQTQSSQQSFKQPTLKDQKVILEKSIGNMDSVSLQDKTFGNSSFSASMYEAATQPCPQASLVTSDDTGQNGLEGNLTEVVDNISLQKEHANESFSTSLCDIATQPHPQDEIEKSHLDQESLVAKIEKNDNMFFRAHDEAVKSHNFSSSVPEVSIKPCHQGTVEKKEVVKEKLKVTEEQDSKLFSYRNDKEESDRFSISIYEAATQPYPHEEKSLFGEVSDEKLAKNIGANDINSTNKNNLLSTSEVTIQPNPQELSANKTRIELSNKEVFSCRNDLDESNSFSTSIYETATQPYPREENLLPVEVTDEKLAKNVGACDIIHSNKNNLKSTSQVTIQPYPQELSVNKTEVRIELSNKEVFSCKNDLDESNSFSTSIYEAATQPYPREENSLPVEVTNEKLAKNVGDCDISRSNKNNLLSMSQVTTQPYPRELSINKTDVGIDEFSDKELLKNNVMLGKTDEINNSFSFSTSLYEVATQPNNYGSEKVLKQDELVRKEDCSKRLNEAEEMDDSLVDEINVKKTCYNEITQSFFEAATQPAPIECHSNGDHNSKNGELSNFVPGGGKEDINSVNIMNNERSECIIELNDNTDKTFKKVEFHDTHLEPGLAATQSVYEHSNTMNLEKDSYLHETQASLVDSSKEKKIEIELSTDFTKYEKREQSTNASGSNYEENTQALIPTETPDIKISKGKKETEKYSNDLAIKEDNKLPKGIDDKKDLLHDVHTFSESFFEAATQPALCHIEPSLEGNQNLPEQSKTVNEGTQPVSNDVVTIQAHKSDFLTIQKSNNISFTASLSDSFFEEATQPYKSGDGKDGIFLDPLTTSICSDLSLDKISKITDELMHGNITPILSAKNKTHKNNNDNEKSFTKIKQNRDISDDNIYKVLNQVPFCPSLSKVQSNTKNDENQPGKLSTQDLKRILESDDLTQKYDEFKQIAIVPINSHQFLEKDHVSLDCNDVLCNDEAQIIGDKKISENNKEPIKTDCLSETVPLSSFKNVNYSKNENEDIIRNSCKRQSDSIPPNSHKVNIKNIASDSDSSQELNIRSNKKHCNIFPNDSQDIAIKDVENDDPSQELNIRSNKKHNIFPPDSQDFINKDLENDDSSQELNIRSNKKRNIFPPDSQDFINKDLENDDSSQELNIRSNKKRNIFPPDSQDFINKDLENDDSSQELNIRSNKKHNIFPPDSQDFINKDLENDDSSQELNIRSNKKRNIFPPDSEDFINKDLENGNNISEKPYIKTNKTQTNVLSHGNKSISGVVENIGISNEKIIENNIKKNNSDDIVTKIDIVAVEKDHHAETREEEQINLSSSKKSNKNQKQQISKALKGRCGEKQSTSCKKNSKESKNKSPPERELTYISRGNITLHSPEVLSELEEQFRLAKVAMSPAQLSVMNEIDGDTNSSQEASESSANQDVQRSVRNKRNVSFKKVSRNNKLPSSYNESDSASPMTNHKTVEKNENKRKAVNSASQVLKSGRSFKKFKKVSPMKNNSPTNENEKTEEASSNETSSESHFIASINSDNSQNSEELGRGKRKRIRTSYEGFILEDDIKRTPRKKLSFSQSEDDGISNTSAVKIEVVNNRESCELQSHQNNDDSIVNIKHTVSIVLHDVRKNSSEVSECLERNIDKSRTSKYKKTEHSSINEGGSSLISDNKKLNLERTSTKVEVPPKTKKSEIINKDSKNSSFSFTDKLDELFNIWGPADRVKLSPRVAKKSYKLLADGKIEGGSSWSSTTSGKKSVVSNTFDKEAKSSSNKINSKSSIEQDLTPSSNKVKNDSNSEIRSRRKREHLQKIESCEPSNKASELNKRRKKYNSDTSENSMEVDSTNENDLNIRKSSRISRKKNLEIMTEELASPGKPECVSTESNKTSKKANQGRIFSDQSKENTAKVTANSSNYYPTVARIKAPPLSSINNMKNKNLKPNDQMKKNQVNKDKLSSDCFPEDGYCFSQEFSFHESKHGKERKLPIANSLPPPLPIRRSSRKKNEKIVEKTVEHVMFTGFADKKTKSVVNILGGQIVESPFTCTVLVTDKIRRTTKFLSALSRGLPIVSPQWLIVSKENGKFMDFNNFLLSDKEAEAMFSFNLKKSIDKARHSKLLDGWTVFVTPTVKPSTEEMKSIIECSGGRFLSKEPTRWPTNSLVVSCNEDHVMWNKFSKRGKAPIIVENEAILLGVLRQELNLESHRLL